MEITKEQIESFKDQFNAYFSKIKYNGFINRYFDIDKMDFNYESIMTGSLFIYEHINGNKYYVSFKNMKLSVQEYDGKFRLFGI